MMRRRLLLSGLLASVVTGPAWSNHTGEPHAVYKTDLDQIPFKYRKRVVAYKTSEKKGTIVVDTKKRYLYLVLGDGRAVRYGVGVGKAGFEWSGEATIQRIAKWPKWTPTPDQIARIPKYKQWEKEGYPPGPLNPLGARSMYLFQDGKDTLYRIHGTSEPHTIGSKVSSGCIRMVNYEIIDLYERVEVGAKVIVQ